MPAPGLYLASLYGRCHRYFTNKLFHLIWSWCKTHIQFISLLWYYEILLTLIRALASPSVISFIKLSSLQGFWATDIIISNIMHMHHTYVCIKGHSTKDIYHVYGSYLRMYKGPFYQGHISCIWIILTYV